MQRNKSRVRFHCSDPSVLTVGIIRNERFTVCAEIPHSRVDAPALSTYTELFRNLALGTNMLSSEETQSRPKSPDDSLLARIESHAKNMAREAGAILSKYFGKGKSLDIEYKDERERDPVTNADKESQEFLAKAITEEFPDHGILGEENEDKEQEESPAPDFVWVLDPLDGTKNFMGGLPIYACSIGVMHKGVPVAAAMFLPWPAEAGGVVLHARKGGGAFADDEPISVFKSDEPKGNRLITLPGYFGMTHSFQKPMRDKVGELRVTGSIAYEMAMTATGVLQYSITTGPRLWDAAGGVMLVMEAGGLVMRGHRTKRPLGLTPVTKWEPMESLVPSWQSGKTTMKELRKWVAPLTLGSPEVVRYVTANMRNRPMLRWRLRRTMRKLKPMRKKDEKG